MNKKVNILQSIFGYAEVLRFLVSKSEEKWKSAIFALFFLFFHIFLMILSNFTFIFKTIFLISCLYSFFIFFWWFLFCIFILFLFLFYFYFYFYFIFCLFFVFFHETHKTKIFFLSQKRSITPFHYRYDKRLNLSIASSFGLWQVQIQSVQRRF